MKEKFRIKNESIEVFVFLIIVSILFFVTFVIALIAYSKIIMIISAIFLGLMVLGGIVHFLEVIIGSSIIVDTESRNVTFRCLFKRRQIAIDDIFYIGVEDYVRARSRRGHQSTPRMKLVVTLLDKSEFSVNDSSIDWKKSFFVLKRRPDEEVNLYKAYTLINSMVPERRFV